MHVCWRRLIVAMIALPVVAGIIIILVCFVSCPLLWAKLPKQEGDDYYRFPLYVVSALALWVLLAVGVFFVWWRRQPKTLTAEPKILTDEPKFVIDEPKIVIDEPSPVVAAEA